MHLTCSSSSVTCSERLCAQGNSGHQQLLSWACSHTDLRCGQKSFVRNSFASTCDHSESQAREDVGIV